MRTALAVCSIAALCYLSNAFAEEASGRVRGVYFEAAPGVLVDASMQRRPFATRWADVEIDGDRAAPKRQLVQIPNDMHVTMGDQVTLRLGEPKSTQLAGVMPSVTLNRALAVTPAGPQFAENPSTGASQVPAAK